MLSYATNSWVAFTSTSVSAPLSVTTNTVTSTTNTTAAISGSVTPASQVGSTGFVYSTSSTASLVFGGTSTNTSSVTSGNFSSFTGNFSVELSGLTRNTTYYARAYVYSNSSMLYSYGNTISFTTTNASTSTPTVSTTAASTDPSCSNSTANLSGSITSNGNETITVAGFQYATDVNFSGAINETTGTSSPFSTALRSLTAATVYFVRAYATNSVGTGYGATLSFTTAAATLPTVSTQSAFQTPPNSISVNGTLSCRGGSPITSAGFQYSTNNDNFTAGVLTITSSLMSGQTSFFGTITGTTQGQTYYIRAFATNSTGTSYGSMVSTTVTARTPLTGSNGNSDYGSTDNQRGESISPMNNSTSLLSENGDKDLIAVSRKKKMLANSVNSASPPENIY
jgi:hypothetical protein